MNSFQFTQILTPEDLVEYNFYMLKQRSNAMLFPRIMGLFCVGLGIYDLFQEQVNLASSIALIVLGLVGVFLLVPFMVWLQKRMIRKRFVESYPPMQVTVNEEGIRFMMAEEETITESNHVEEVKEPSDNELREQEQEEQEPTKEAIYEDTPNIEQEKQELEKLEPQPEETNPDRAFTIPWGGVVKIVDTEYHLYIHMVGYQAMVIQKSACHVLDELIAYAKEKLGDEKRYIVKMKKEKDHE